MSFCVGIKQQGCVCMLGPFNLVGDEFVCDPCRDCINRKTHESMQNNYEPKKAGHISCIVGYELAKVPDWQRPIIRYPVQHVEIDIKCNQDAKYGAATVNSPSCLYSYSEIKQPRKNNLLKRPNNDVANWIYGHFNNLTIKNFQVDGKCTSKCHEPNSKAENCKTSTWHYFEPFS